MKCNLPGAFQKSCLAPLNLNNSRQDFSSKDILIYRLFYFIFYNSFQRFQHAYEVTSYCEAERQEEGILYKDRPVLCLVPGLSETV